MSDFKVLKKIGQGAFGKVYKVQRLSDGEVYAIKVINVSQMDKEGIQNTLNEVRILSSIEHCNIVCYKEAFMAKQGREMNIVMEYVSGGDLENVILQHKKKRQYLKENFIWKILCQILMGLKKLHDLKVIHRDIKAGNVFISKDYSEVKLGDLNVAKVAKNDFASTQVGTPYYLAPEIWNKDLYSYKCDVFSLGVLMYELTSLRLPFEGKSLQQLYTKINRGLYRKLPSNFSQELQQIVHQMLKVNPNQRPSVDDLLQNNAISNKMYEFGFKDIVKEQQNLDKLLQTILVPRNLKLLNKKLPQQKKYKQRASSVSRNINSNQIEHLINKVQQRNNKFPPIKNLQKSNQNLPPLKPNKKRRQSPQVKRYREYLQKLNEKSRQNKQNMRRGNSYDKYQQKRIRF